MAREGPRRRRRRRRVPRRDARPMHFDVACVADARDKEQTNIKGRYSIGAHVAPATRGFKTGPSARALLGRIELPCV